MALEFQIQPHFAEQPTLPSSWLLRDFAKQAGSWQEFEINAGADSLLGLRHSFGIQWGIALPLPHPVPMEQIHTSALSWFWRLRSQSELIQ